MPRNPRRPAPAPISRRPRPSHPKRSRFLLLAAITCAILATTAGTALAADAGRVSAADDIPTVVNNLRNWLIGILAVVATLFLTLGGVRYLMANGDVGEIEKAKTAFKSAGIGYSLAILAPVVVTVLRGIVGG